MADRTRSDREYIVPPDGEQTARRETDQVVRESPSVASLVQDIVADVQNLVRSEIRLAKAEVKEEATKAGKGVGMLVAGAVLGAYALGFLLLTGVYALDEVIPDWLAALIVAVVVAAVAGVLAKIGMDKVKDVNPKPEETIETLKEDAEWAKRQVR